MNFFRVAIVVLGGSYFISCFSTCDVDLDEINLMYVKLVNLYARFSRNIGNVHECVLRLHITLQLCSISTLYVGRFLPAL
jgi:hypothetical protein